MFGLPSFSCISDLFVHVESEKLYTRDTFGVKFPVLIPTSEYQSLSTQCCYGFVKFLTSISVHIFAAVFPGAYFKKTNEQKLGAKHSSVTAQTVSLKCT